MWGGSRPSASGRATRRATAIPTRRDSAYSGPNVRDRPVASCKTGAGRIGLDAAIVENAATGIREAAGVRLSIGTMSSRRGDHPEISIPFEADEQLSASDVRRRFAYHLTEPCTVRATGCEDAVGREESSERRVDTKAGRLCGRADQRKSCPDRSSCTYRAA